MIYGFIGSVMGRIKDVFVKTAGDDRGIGVVEVILILVVNCSLKEPV